MKPPPHGRIWSVRALTRDVQRCFERFWPRIVVEGELAEIHVPRSGHCYFQLREEDAVLGGVMWRAEWRASRFRPEVGQRIRCFGKLGLYRGRVQVYVHRLEPAGEGRLQQELRERMERLRRDGLLDPARKRPLPRFPRTVGLVTSPSGAAIADFLRVSRERFPAARILLAPCVVQGPEAPASLIRALELLWDHGGIDVIVLTRGGGAKEDLLAFMDETLARVIAASPVPVVSAVGHAIDTTLADRVADAVAPTPSAAAHTVLPDRSASIQQVEDAVQRLHLAMVREIGRHIQRVDALTRRLRHPGERLVRQGHDLRRSVERLDRAMLHALEGRRLCLAALAGRLDSLSPLHVLARGYAVVRTPSGSVLTDPNAVGSGDRLTVELAGGRLDVTVV